jgi:hypothetical protein
MFRAKSIPLDYLLCFHPVSIMTIRIACKLAECGYHLELGLGDQGLTEILVSCRF